MRVRCYAQGKFYTILSPEGTRLVRRPGHMEGEVADDDHLIVPLNGKMIRIPCDPPELLPLLAESGNFGVTLVGEPEPDMSLAGASCPGCGEMDVNWLQLKNGSEAVQCDRCGADFEMPEASVPDSIPIRMAD